MKIKPAVSDVVSLMLEISKESGDWAKHYDGARRALTMLVIAVSGGGTSFVISQSLFDYREVALFLITFMCLTITGFAGLYSRLYYENFSIHKDFRQLATKYLVGDRSAAALSKKKIDKFIYEGRFSALGLEVEKMPEFRPFYNEKYRAEIGDYSEAALVEEYNKMYRKFFEFKLVHGFRRSAISFWVGICLVYSLLPLGALIFVEGPERSLSSFSEYSLSIRFSNE